jgi:hypothetical protein
MLRAIAYDASRRELRVRFTAGTIYRYYEVPKSVAMQLLDPPGGSAGRYFNDQVRDKYDYDEEAR